MFSRLADALATAAITVALFTAPMALSAALTGCDSAGGDCSRVCTAGKACEDNCIAASSTCNVGAGCDGKG